MDSKEARREDERTLFDLTSSSSSFPSPKPPPSPPFQMSDYPYLGKAMYVLFPLHVCYILELISICFAFQNEISISPCDGPLVRS